jgi:hypothetical protein
MYTENWDYTLTSNSQPYAINNGAPYTQSNTLIIPAQTYVNKDYAGSNYEFAGNNYIGSYALQFTFDPRNAYAAVFHSGCYGNVSSHTPAIASLGAAVELGWASQTGYQQASDTAGASGDFAGTGIYEDGIYTVLFLKRDVVGDANSSDVAACVTAPSGVKYRTGWARVDDNYKHNQIGCYLYDSSGYVILGPMSVADDLTAVQIESFLALGEIDNRPVPSITPSTKTSSAPVLVTLTPPSTLPAGWSLYYTTNGVDPTSSPLVGTLYAGPFTVGSPFTIGTTSTVKAAYFKDATGEVAMVASETYTFALTPPVFLSGGPTTQVNAYAPIQVTWVDPPSDSSTQILYTIDGTDPTTSLSAIVWQPGDVIPFNGHPTDPGSSTLSTSQYNHPVYAVLKHIASGTMSSVSTTALLFYLGPTAFSSVPSRTNDSFSMPVVYPYASGIDLKYQVTLDGVMSETTQAPTISIPFDRNKHAFSIRVVTSDNTLYTDFYDVSMPYDPESGTYTLTKTLDFYQKKPKLPAKTAVTSTSVSITPSNLNTSSELHYTLDGSTPTQTSPMVSGALDVASGSSLKVIAYRNGMSSDVATLDVLGEYEVTEVTTSVDGINYLYHVAAQRTMLTSRLGSSNIDVVVGSNVSTATKSVTVGGQSYQISLWDHTDAVGAYNGFNGFLWMSKPTEVWSRLSYLEGTFKFDWTHPSTLLPLNSLVTFLKVSAVSRVGVVSFRYVIDTATQQTSIIRTFSNHNVVSQETTTPGATLTVDAVNSFTLTVGSSVSFTDGVGTSTETNDAFAGMLWSVDCKVNPLELAGYSETTPTNIPATITTTATSGKLRIAPGSIMCSRSNVTAQGSIALDFTKEESLHQLRHSMITDGSFSVPVSPPAVIGYSNLTKALRVDGVFALAMPGVFDAGSDFDVEFKLSADFLALMTYPESTVNLTTLPTVALYLSDPTSHLNDSSSIPTGISLRMFVPSDRPGAYPVYLELYSSGYSPARLTLSSNSKQITLKLSGRSAGISLSAIVDGVETLLTTIPAITGQREVRFRRTGSTKQARKQLTDLISYFASATFTQARCDNPVLINADFMLRGEATGFDTTALSVPDNVAYAVWFNPTTKTISSEVIDFEPSDGRLLVGVIETNDNNIIWTNTMFSTLVKARTQVDGQITGGTVIGVGSKLKAINQIVSWEECGYERSVALGDLDWNTPMNHLDMRKGTQIVRTLDKQKIRVTASILPQ